MIGKFQVAATNIWLENYNIKNVPTELAYGGVLLYIKKATNCRLRPELMISKKKWTRVSFYANNLKILPKHRCRMHA